MALALTIIGLLAIPYVMIYNVYVKQKAIRESDGYLQTIQDSLEKYVLQNGRYPLPAARNLAPTANGFGESYPAIAGNPPLTVAASIAALPNCALAIATVCKTPGMNLGASVPIPPAINYVFIGDVPFATLGLPQRFMKDGYGGKFTYAVSAPLTDITTFREDWGTISVLDRTGGLTTFVTGNNAQYVVVSHGSDNKGAFSLQGTQIKTCTGLGNDITNCDNNAQFNNNYDYNPDGTYTRQETDVAGAGFYDDYLKLAINSSGNIWALTASPQPDIYTRNVGNARIGTWAPTGATGEIIDSPTQMPVAKLEVYGDIASDQIKTDRLCPTVPNTVASNCGGPGYCGCPNAGVTSGLVNTKIAPNVFSPAVIAGNIGSNPGDSMSPADADKPGGGINCGDMGVTGIHYADEKCFKKLPPSLGKCGAGEYVSGITATGQFKCSPVAP